MQPVRLELWVIKFKYFDCMIFKSKSIYMSYNKILLMIVCMRGATDRVALPHFNLHKLAPLNCLLFYQKTWKH